MRPFRVAAALLLLALVASLSHAATGVLTWTTTTTSSPPLLLDHVNLNSADVGPRSAMDAAGNLYVAASSLSPSPSNACGVYLKYSGADGSIVWRRDVCNADFSTFSGSNCALNARRMAGTKPAFTLPAYISLRPA